MRDKERIAGLESRIDWMAASVDAHEATLREHDHAISRVCRKCAVCKRWFLKHEVREITRRIVEGSDKLFVEGYLCHECDNSRPLGVKVKP